MSNQLREHVGASPKSQPLYFFDVPILDEPQAGEMGYPSKGPRKSRNDFSGCTALSSMELGNRDDNDFAQGRSPHESQRTSHRSKARSPRLICRAPDSPCEDLHSFLSWSLFVNLGQRPTSPSFPVGKGSFVSSSLKPFLGIMFSTDVGISESVSKLPATFGAA